MNKKMTTVALAGLMAVSTGAVASQSRWGGLGLASTFVADVQDIWTLPTAVLDNADAFYLEGIDDENWGGAHISLFGGVLGVWSGRELGLEVATFRMIDELGTNAFPDFEDLFDPDFGGNGAGWTGYSWLAYSTNADLDLFYGMNVNDNTQVALGIMLARNSHNNEDNNAIPNTNAGARDGFMAERTRNAFGVSIGLGMTEVGPLSGLWAGLQYESFSNSNVEADVLRSTTTCCQYNVDETADASDIQIRVAGEMAGDNGSSTLFDIALDMESSEYAVTETNTGGNLVVDPGEKYDYTADDKGMGFSLGAAKMISGEKGFGLVGVLLSRLSQTSEYTETDNSASAGVDSAEFNRSVLNLEWVAGAEAQAFFDWLTVRAGASGSVYNSAKADGTATPLWSAGTTAGTYVTNAEGSLDLEPEISIGFSVALGDFVIDAVLDQAFIVNGPYFVSGNSSGMSGMASATWTFGGRE
jgi:hypothetical protein